MLLLILGKQKNGLYVFLNMEEVTEIHASEKETFIKTKSGDTIKTDINIEFLKAYDVKTGHIRYVLRPVADLVLKEPTETSSSEDVIVDPRINK